MTFERSERFKNLSSAKQALLLKTIRKRQKQRASARCIPRLAHQEAPLSFAQRRMWFLTQLEAGHHFYNVPLGMRLRGRLRKEMLEQSLTEIIRRHEVLRTTFPTRAGVPVQVIVPPAACMLPVIDLSSLPLAERQKRLAQLSKEEAQHPFDLAGGPIFRVKLLRLAPEEHILLLTMHHIISDGWSTGIIHRELIQLYRAFSRGQPSPLSELPIQYADFAIWQHQVLQEEKLKEHLAYWQQQLADIPKVIALPTDFPRPALQSYRGKREPLLLRPDFLSSLKSLCQETGTTLFMLLLAAFQVLLFRYSGQYDIVVGTPVASRDPIEVEDLIGFFSNTLILRASLSGSASFRAVLKQTKDSAIEAYAHQEMPFERLVEILQPERSLSYAPLFQVMFTLQTAVTSTEDLPDLEIIDWEGEPEISRFDLTFFLEESRDGLTGYAEYSIDLFRAETIKRLISHWQCLLGGIVANPDASIATLNLLSDEERRQLLLTWNTSPEAPPQEYIQSLFEQQVERTPDAIALIFADSSLTYYELNLRANSLAHYLRARGVGPEVRVGLCVERSLDLVIGLLGIVKAGGAFLPLDPSYPPERLTYMLTDAGAQFVLLRAELLSRLPEDLQATLLLLNTAYGSLSSEQVENPACVVTADTLAYVTYTSGSTGTPKGVMVPQRGLSNLAVSQVQAFRVDAQSRIFQFAAFSFDAFISEVLMTLLSGAVLDLGDEQVPRAGGAFWAFLQERAITVITLPPSILATLPHENLPGLKTIVVAGETCTADIIAPWTRWAHVHNAYGPTEATVCATIARNCDGSHKPTIGYSMANVQVYILDSWLQPAPIGVPGEIYIGGIGLARGYHNNPALTAERFLPHPFSAEPGARLYKTGDRARYLAIGQIEFLGRFDTQVKLHGFRIELQEIEAVLNECPQVRDCTVTLREDIPGDYRLVAYVVTGERDQGTTEITGEAIRHYLQERLPVYMIPAALVLLDALPINAHGKVDRRALPVPNRELLLTTSTYAEPRTAIEQILARVWEDVLRLERVSITDNFFALGGDSILSVQVVARAGQQGLRFLPKQLFQYQTIKELSVVVEKSTPLHIQQGPVVGEVPLTPVQYWFLAQALPNRHHWNQALLLEVSPQLEVKYLVRALTALLFHHDALRLRTRKQGNDWQQVCTEPGEAMPFQQVDLSSLLASDQMSTLAAMEAEMQASLHLSAGPLMRAALFYFGEQQPALLLLIIHHMAVDSISWNILLEDLQTAYQDCSRGKAIRLPLKTTSLQQWGKRLAAYAASEQLQQEREYWLGIVGGPRAVLPLDNHLDWQENQESSAGKVVLTFSVDETQQLIATLPARYQVRPDEILLVAVAWTLCAWAQTSSIVIDVEGHGREDLFEDVDISRTVGWFTALFPVRLELKQASTLLEALQNVRQQLSRLPNHGIGYGILRYLSKDRDLSAISPPEVVFNYLGHLDYALPPGGIFQALRPAHGPLHDPQGCRAYLLEIEGYISGGKLQVDWIYGQSLHKHTTMERLAQAFRESLRTLIVESRPLAGPIYQPADFPDVDLSQEALQQLLEEIDFA